MEGKTEQKQVAVADRRSRERYPLQWQVDLRPTAAAGAAAHAGLGRSLDISAEGLYVRTDALLEEGSRVEISLRMPAAPDGRVTDMRGLGRVVRTGRPGGSPGREADGCGAGIRAG